MTDTLTTLDLVLLPLWACVVYSTVQYLLDRVVSYLDRRTHSRRNHG